MIFIDRFEVLVIPESLEQGDSDLCLLTDEEGNCCACPSVNVLMMVVDEMHYTLKPMGVENVT